MAVFSSAPSRPPDGLRARERAPVPVCRVAWDAVELEAHFAIRREIFVHAQRLFELDDRDAHDAEPSTVHAVGLAGGVVAGAVRLYPLGEPGVWKGDRLAVRPAERVHRVGALLVAFAVRTAAERGGERMIAQIQLPNVAFFERLGWHRDGDPAPMLGVAHQPMAIELSPGR